MDRYSELWKNQLLRLGAVEKASLRELTSFKLGGEAAFVLTAGEEEKLLAALSLCRQYGIPTVLLGNGSNLLAPDEGFEGLILRLAPPQEAVFEGCLLRASAGCSLTALARKSLQQGFMGLERLCGIPGSLGGAIAMNAGAYGGEIVSVLQRVKLIKDGRSYWEAVDKAAFGYRKSPYCWPEAFVLEAELLLTPDDGTAKATMEQCMQARRDKQPLEYPSAGSFFKRPAGYFAGALIEGCGMKGYRLGDAQISDKHAGFMINRGHTTRNEVLALSKLVQDRVLSCYGVSLQREVKLLEEAVCTF